jgi:S1-C subfamily serine protease
MNNNEGMIRTEAIVTEDPAASMPVGSRIRFLPALFPAEGNHISDWVRNWDHFRGVVMWMSFADQECQRVWGSAVAVAPGVALAARHVVEPEANRLISGRSGTILVGIAPHGATIWRPHDITWSNSDIAIISSSAASEIPPDSIFHQAVLTARVPEKGESVLVVGFVAAESEFNLAEVGYSVSGNVVVSCGKVTDYLPDGHKQKPWPMIAVDVGTPGGMSGGPAFDHEGRLIGVLCASSGAGPDQYSLISLLEPALSMSFPSAWVLRSENRKTTLASLAALGGCFVET